LLTASFGVEGFSMEFFVAAIAFVLLALIWALLPLRSLRQ
jgi:hypothetical protein